MELFFEELMEFMGRWHPLLVHLPIGMLVVAFFMAILTERQKYRFLASAIPVVLLFGAVAAVFASITGYLLSLSGGYEEEVLDFHLWLGVAVVVMSILLYGIYREKKNEKEYSRQSRHYRLAIFVVLMLLIGFTGHFGGTLTHGKGYLSEALPTVVKQLVGQEQQEEEIAGLTNVQEAILYTDVIAPILKQRCQSCHGAKKKEGNLVLHTQEGITKGGEDGVVLLPSKMAESELYARLILPEGDKKRMPPKGRRPITPDQIKLIGWWIAEGASFDKKVSQVNQSSEIKALLAKLEQGTTHTDQSEYADLPEAKVLPEDIIKKIQAKGIKVIPVSADSRYVSINAINYPEFSDNDMEELLLLKDNIIQLKLAKTVISDAAMENIAKIPYLKKLHIEHSKVSDEGLRQLKGAESLRYINLFGTAVSDEGLKHLAEIKSLKQIYAYQTNITALGIKDLKTANIDLYVDSGAYTLPFLKSDTVKY